MMKYSQKTLIFWFSLALTFAAIYASLAMKTAFSAQYVVQDDARVYVFWMQRFLEPDLLKGDFITDYFKSVTPLGFATIYKIVAALGITPLVFSKILPLILVLVATSYCFVLTLEILPIPIAGFISALLLNQSLWMRDDIASATPRSFTAILLMATLYYMWRRSWVIVCISVALLGLLYPPTMFLGTGMLVFRLFLAIWPNIQAKIPAFTIIKPSETNNYYLSQKEFIFCIAGLGISFLIMLFYAINQSEYGPTITASEGRNWAEFMQGGRAPFFDDAHPWKFWFQNNNSGFRLSLNPPYVAAAFLLPLLIKFSSYFPLAKKITGAVMLLPQLLVVSTGMFLAAHAVWLRLFFPDRYTMHSLQIIMAISAGLAITVLLDGLKQWAEKTPDISNFLPSINKKQVLAWSAIAIVASVLVLYPNLAWGKRFPKTGYIAVEAPIIYDFLLATPPDTMVASLAEEANNIPTFAKRAILVGREYGNPYHIGFYREFKQRSTDLIRAQYTSNLQEVKEFIQKYKISFWLVEKTAFNPDYLTDNWRRLYQPAASEAATQLQQGNIPAIVKIMRQCSAVDSGNFVLLSAPCIMNSQ